MRWLLWWGGLFIIRLPGLFVSHLTMLLATVYFSSLAFCTRTQGQSLGDRLRRCALRAFMDVTTVGSNIIAVTVTGRVLSVLLATGYDDVPDLYGLCHQPDSKKNKEKEEYYKQLEAADESKPK